MAFLFPKFRGSALSAIPPGAVVAMIHFIVDRIDVSLSNGVSLHLIDHRGNPGVH